MSDLQTFCTVTGICYNLASSFGLSIPWTQILKEGAKEGSRYVWKNKNSYSLVLKEAHMANIVLQNFVSTIEKIEEYQKNVNVQICSLHSAQQFIKDFVTVLLMYSPEQISTWQAHTSGDKLRQDLQYYMNFANLMMNNIMLELNTVMMKLQTINSIASEKEKIKLLNDLHQECQMNFNISYYLHNETP